MGTKPGKHARDPSGGGDGSRDSPLPKRSPKSTPTRQSDLPSSIESTPARPQIGVTSLPDDPNTSLVDSGIDQSRRSSSEKENFGEMSSTPTMSSKSPSKSSKSKTKFKKMDTEQRHEEVREEIIKSQQSPVRLEQRELEPLTPLVINDNQDISMDRHHPQATSTPATNGQYRSPPLSPDSGTDQSDDEAFSPSSDHQLHSPSVSLNSTSTGCSSLRHSRNQSDSFDSRRSVQNFGRFYNTSYLGMGKAGESYLKTGPSDNRSKTKPGSHFHRPANFTYSRERPDFLRKKATGMSALVSTKRVVKVRRSSSPGDLRTQEPVKLSMLPSAKPKLANELDKIERDDWPGPASPAALLPEILRQRRRSKGEKEEEEELVVDNPKLNREYEEMSKIKDESGIGRVLYKELEELKSKPPQPLDPWKASRAPSAKFEPRYRTRFQSPMFASPSRFVDRPRYAWDDSDIRTYRSVSTLANLPTPKPGYGPSYMTPRAATLPLAGAYGARFDFRYFDFGESQDDRPERSTHTSSSTLTGDTSSRRHYDSYNYEGPSISLLKLQKSTWHTEADPTIYPYDQLKITNFDLPKDVDTNLLEIHLANDEFERLFKTTRESFYKMAEWKRNDIKRKLHLY